MLARCALGNEPPLDQRIRKMAAGQALRFGAVATSTIALRELLQSRSAAGCRSALDREGMPA